jgi:hypothetical protein
MVSFLVFHDPQLDGQSEMPMGMYINGKMHFVKSLTRAQVASEIKRMHSTVDWNTFDIGMVPRTSGISLSLVEMKLKDAADACYLHVMMSFHDDGNVIGENSGVQSFRGGYPGNDWDTDRNEVKGCYTASRPTHDVGPNVIGQAGPLVFTAESFQEEKYIACNLMMDVKVHNLINPDDTEAVGIKEFFGIPDDKWDTIKYIQIARSVHVYADPPTFGYKNRKMHVVFFGRNSIIDITVDINKHKNATQHFHGIVSDVEDNGNGRNVCKYDGDSDPLIVSDGKDLRVNDMPITPPVPDGWDSKDTPSLFGLGVTHGQDVYDTKSYQVLIRVLDANRPPRTNAEYHENMSLIRWVQSMRKGTDPVFIVRGYSNSNDPRGSGWYKWENWDDPIEKGQEQNDYCAFHRFNEFPENSDIKYGWTTRAPISNSPNAKKMKSILTDLLRVYTDGVLMIGFLMSVYRHVGIEFRYASCINDLDDIGTSMHGSVSGSVIKLYNDVKSDVWCTQKPAFDIVHALAFQHIMKSRAFPIECLHMITRIVAAPISAEKMKFVQYSFFFTAVAVFDIIKNGFSVDTNKTPSLRAYATEMAKQSQSQSQSRITPLCDVNMLHMFRCIRMATSSNIKRSTLEYIPSTLKVCRFFADIAKERDPMQFDATEREKMNASLFRHSNDVQSYES